MPDRRASLLALALVLGPSAGAQEHVITGTVLLTFAASWALLATLSMLWTEQPQRWAAMPAGFMALAGAGLLAFAPSGCGHRRARLGVAAAVACACSLRTVVRVHRDLHSRTRALGRVPAAGRVRAMRRRRGLSNRPRSRSTAARIGTRPVGRRRRTPASSDAALDRVLRP